MYGTHNVQDRLVELYRESASEDELRLGSLAGTYLHSVLAAEGTPRP